MSGRARHDSRRLLREIRISASGASQHSASAEMSLGAAECAGHVQQLGSESLLSDLMEVRVSETQRRRREAGSERSVEQKRESMNKNRM